MPVIKHKSTKNLSSTLDYNRHRTGSLYKTNCLSEKKEDIKTQMREVRELWGKNDGRQGHVFYISLDKKDTDKIRKSGNYEKFLNFSYDIGMKLSNGGQHLFDVTVHTTQDYVHSHILLNSVNTITGKKLTSNGKDTHKWRDIVNNLSREYNFNIPPKNRNIKKDQVDIQLEKKGKISQKDLLREQLLDVLKDKPTKFRHFESWCRDKYNISINERGNYVNKNGKVYRGKTLGETFTRKNLEVIFQENIKFWEQEEKERTRRNNIEKFRIKLKTKIDKTLKKDEKQTNIPVQVKFPESTPIFSKEIVKEKEKKKPTFEEEIERGKWIRAYRQVMSEKEKDNQEDEIKRDEIKRDEYERY